MKETKIEVAKLLETLRQNREDHVREYKDAKKNWKKACKSALKRRLKVLDSEEFEFDKFDLSFDLYKPMSFVKEYDVIISQLEWEVEDTIQLTQQDFKQFVLNQWPWSEQFAATTSLYNAR